MRCIVANALRCSKAGSSRGDTGDVQWPSLAAASSSQGRRAAKDEEAMAEVDAFVRDHITVVCPALPRGMTPEEAAKKFTRQYPVVRYCVEHGLPIIPVDDPKSLSLSALLKEMLASRKDVTTSTTGSHAHHLYRSPPMPSHRASHALPSSPRCGAGALLPPANGKPNTKGSSPSSASSATPHTWVAQGRSLADYDLTVVVSFRYFLPKRLLRVLPPVINMHPSLLPRYRGASPIFTALCRNETLGGVSITQMKPEQTAMDSGNVLWQCEVPIPLDMDIRLYFPLVTQIGAAGLCDLIFGEAPPAWRPSATTGVVSVLAPPSLSARPSASWSHGCSRSQSQTHQDGVDCRSTKAKSTNGATSPSWFALRQRSLTPLVHRPGGRGAAPGSATSHGTHMLTNTLFSATKLPFLSSLPASSENCSAVRVRQMVHTLDDTTLRHGLGNSEESPSTNGADVCHPRCCQPWMTLCRAPTLITPEAVHAASRTLRSLFFQNVGSPPNAAAAAPAIPACSAAAPAECKGAPVSKKTVSLSAAAEMGVTTTMKCAEVFPASVLSPYCDWPDSFTYSWKFAQVQAYPTYADFSEDPYHAPLLPKDAAVIRFSSMDAAEAFGVWRAFVGGDYFQPSVNATLDKGSTPVRNQLVHRALRRILLKRAKSQGTLQQYSECAEARHEKMSAATVTLASEDSDVPVGVVAGKHVDLDIFSPAGLQLLTEAENTLRIPCTFTQVVNPVLAPACVCEELAEVERSGHPQRGASTCMRQHQSQQPHRCVRFYRAPAAIFRSLLSSRTSDSAAQETTRRARYRSVLAVNERGTAGTDGTHLPLRQQPYEAAGEGTVPHSTTTSPRAASLTAAEKGQRQPGHGHSRAGGVATAVQTEEPGEDEEAPEDYVPEVIHAAPPTQHHVHIPPGTGYFLQCDESYGAIKCKEGWFLWKEAHMKWANKAQPAVLIRKGLAMKTGVLYVGLFSEYS
ncbi:putative methionyl-tRNA formyltransferase [Leishmania major strain Friedlin]|uniref:Putative methionyl-tRNA formyltransferase n=1 Tax=Leishmania major TaxID=5664 RepID=Q4Q551_LEIMA|nr:putative methionyl-tRNA formyltransferase [Leishmania major strain Friedlin]CAG9580359.1 methionyl-tRNA_formyltransferase_-_putative [Leishmania major strain Friedlin]CAJ08751.1 putative methionyl-tRNA formyltransferase [Leishmania major strain Friedlin]|eukprot:XP_001685547.1 putative methionyl-tRNA formyltransferase [Leishmania major strain Friedlin]